MRKPYSYRDDASVPPFNDSVPLAVMDANCAICSWGARMLHRIDGAGTTQIAPVQSLLGQALLRHYGLDPNDPSSWLFLHNGVAHVDFDAVIYAGRHFGGWGQLARVLQLIPKPIRDWLYQRLAQNRYRVFGKADLCTLPDPALQKRIIR